MDMESAFVYYVCESVKSIVYIEYYGRPLKDACMRNEPIMVWCTLPHTITRNAYRMHTKCIKYSARTHTCIQTHTRAMTMKPLDWILMLLSSWLFIRNVKHTHTNKHTNKTSSPHTIRIKAKQNKFNVQ